MKPVLSSLLTILLAMQLPLSQAIAHAQEGPPPAKLDIVIIEGEGAVNNVKQRIAREPIVEVRDENRKPVAGAAVVFMLPNNGATGVFTNGARMLTVTTDQAGRATMSGFQPANTAGRMQIRVTASFRGQTASTTITQTNALGSAGSGAAGAGAGMSAAKIITILAIVGGAAAAGGIVAATRGGGSPAPTPAPPAVIPTVISPGNPSVGPPR